jgi:3-isopropylmalate/(R)-2-methylmalate dehydratase small subunit
MMEPLTILTAVAAPLLRDNVDTDAIIPSREIKSVSKLGLADGLFAGWRYTEIDGRELDPEFVLNRPDYRSARILLAGSNFGCGSSREHAAWALAEYGFRAIVAPSFNPIFRGNCVRNGMVPVELTEAEISAIAAEVGRDPQRYHVTIDLPRQSLRSPGGTDHAFGIEDEAKEMLIHALDAIDLTLRRREQIDSFRSRDRLLRPWAYFKTSPESQAETDTKTPFAARDYPPVE